MNTLLFITKYLNGDFIAIIRELHVVLVAFVVVFIAMAVDLAFRLRANKKSGIDNTSTGFRRSTIKFLEYYGCMLVAFLVDIIASISESVNLPYATFLVALILVAIEAFSIYENIQNKNLKSIDKEDVKMLLTLFEQRGDLLTAATNAVRQKLDETPSEVNTNPEKKDDEK